MRFWSTLKLSLSCLLLSAPIPWSPVCLRRHESRKITPDATLSCTFYVARTRFLHPHRTPASSRHVTVTTPDGRSPPARIPMETFANYSRDGDRMRSVQELLTSIQSAAG